MSVVRTLAAASIVCLVVGCGTMGGDGLRRGKAKEKEEIRRLRQELVEEQERATMAEVELERLRRQQEGSGESAGNLERAASKPVREGDSEKPGSGRSVAAPIVVEVVELEEEDLAPETGVTGRAPAAETVVDEPSSRRSAPTTSSQLRSVPPEGQTVYDRGYTLFHQGRYIDAESAFQQFLAAYGDTDLGDNAQFWIGEARFVRGDVRGALAAFRETVRRYPSGNKVPDSLLKTGDCLRDLGDLEGARAAYGEVVRSYPATAAAAVAEDRLRQLP